MATKDVYTFDLSDTIKIIDGSIYRVVPKGLELITWTGESVAVVADGTVRISAMAFAGDDITKVVLPSTVAAIGHKAFFGCNKLQFISFSSYKAPILEEEYDSLYYQTMENIPAAGLYEFQDNYGNPIVYEGNKIIPYFMWNVTSLPGNFFYGANFVDYVGKVEEKITMISPVNGKNYDSFIMNQYFALTVEGAAAADDTTLAAIEAINKIPTNVSEITLAHKGLVDAARAAYNKIISDEQRALVPDSLLSILKDAEQMIEDLEYLAGGDENVNVSGKDKSKLQATMIVLIVVVSILGAMVIALGVLLFIFIKKIKNGEITVTALPVFPETTNESENTDNISEQTEECAVNEEQIVVEAEETKTEEVVEEENKPEEPFTKKIFDKPVDFDDITEGYVTDDGSEEKRKIIIAACVAVAAVALIVAIVIGIVRGNRSYFHDYNKEGYTISIVLDSNGGTFKGSDSSIVDLYNPEKVGEDGIQILAPDDARRGKENMMQVTNPGHFLAGWYTDRIPVDENDPSKGYTYSGKWDFENDRVLIDPNANYSADYSVLTLYAAWVPYYNFEIYTTDESGNSYLLSTVSAINLTLPQWNEGDVTLAMDNFPGRDGYTLDTDSICYLDTMDEVEGIQSGSKLVITGKWDEATATSLTPTIKLHTEWFEGKTYRIYSTEDFVKNADLNGYYELYSDLYFNDSNWPSTFLNGKFNGKIYGNKHKIYGATFKSSSRNDFSNGLFSSLGENAYIEKVDFVDITHVIDIDIMAVAQDATFGLLAGTAADGAGFKNVTVSGKLVFGDSCATLVGGEGFTINTLIASGKTNGITAKDITVEKQNAENNAFELVVDEDGTVTIVAGSN